MEIVTKPEPVEDAAADAELPISPLLGEAVDCEAADVAAAEVIMAACEEVPELPAAAVAAPVAAPVTSLFFAGALVAAPLADVALLYPVTPSVIAAAEAAHEGPVAEAAALVPPLRMN